VKLSSWSEIGSDGNVLLTPCGPKGITGYDDDDCTSEKQVKLLASVKFGYEIRSGLQNALCCL
jgi:hypothetical protein